MSAEKTNIILIGMPGAGKSTLGKRLAKSLHLHFIDTDRLIEQHESLRVQQIIDQHGTNYFRAVEQKVLCGLNVESHLIATGGSAVLSERSMRHLALFGKLVYLQISLATMLARVQDTQTRGVVKNQTDTLQDVYKRRIPYYQRYADLVVDNDTQLTDLRYSELLQAVSLEK